MSGGEIRANLGFGLKAVQADLEVESTLVTEQKENGVILEGTRTQFLNSQIVANAGIGLTVGSNSEANLSGVTISGHPKGAVLVSDSKWTLKNGTITGNAGSGIELIHYDAEGDDNANKNGEWIVLRANQDISLKGWTLADELGDRGVGSQATSTRFPEGFVLSLGQRVKIFTGCGTDTETELYWCARTQIWDNGEDTALLKDKQDQLVDRCHYGDPDGSERGKSEFLCETRQFR